MFRGIEKFISKIDGSVATTMGVIAVPLMLCCGAAVDYASLYKLQASLQEAADAAALASAKELGLVSTKDNTVKTVANDYAMASLYNDLGDKKNLHSAKIETAISNSRKEVTVDIAYTWTPLLIQHFKSDALPIRVKSTASLAGEQSICVLALDQKSSRAIDMGGKATVTANDCVIYSNSSDTRGISVFKNSTMMGSEIMSSGGYEGSAASFRPLPLTDTPIVVDPLKDRVPPSVGACDHKGYSTNVSATLWPGVYCGGLDIGDDAVVSLKPGDYIIKEGPLTVRGNSTLIGQDVGFYLTGSSATFDFGVSTQASLSARESGPLSGILFFEDRNSSGNRQFTIRSKDAEKFEGAIYLPNGTLWIDKASKVGQKSSWTAIIANRISVGNGPNIVINADYASSTIPVPDGIGGGDVVRLKR